ncbi:bifunctional diguanylate cyclase/phosphodiesterase [Quadrisphaera sp. INWT6]|uniref:putative bifunctional diguanylate cyclase/phosphodiesterase n=1 Tax=Quadrisphaera sp. INWT6 TaxID=2596917 RepID=UPI00189201CA|nr:bifunctional diguanylate cyclase/phosphodiesterase [Quadrisphaera sp. INWT6]MBF5082906.1 bifunctional diguanylate cyclase/phosphodiesterase [Quadrisphaera sp. INWT6]
MSTTPASPPWRLRLHGGAVAAPGERAQRPGPLLRQLTSGRTAMQWRRAPVVSYMPSVPLLLAVLMGTGGAIVLVSTFLPSASSDRVVALVRALDVVAITSAFTFTRLMQGRRRWAQHAVMLTATLLVSLAVLVSGGGGTALVYAVVYYPVVVYGFFALSRLGAVLHLLLITAVGAPLLAQQEGVGVAEQVVLWGVAAMLGLAVAWLVAMHDGSETDQLTSLPDRSGIERSLERALRRPLGSSADQHHVAFALLNIDSFTAYNAAHGEGAGDELLAQLATTWAAALPEDVLLGRWAGDAFAVVAPGRTAHQATLLVEELRRSTPAGVTASAGVAGWGREETQSMLVARTEGALYLAKQGGRDRVHEHSGPGTDGREVRRGLARVEFEVHFQPVVDLATGEVHGAEALVRWAHPTRGLVGPDQFLPDAERSGAIVDLGGWVLREACHRAARWAPTPSGHLPHVAVNASGRELADPLYAAAVEEALISSRLAPSRLVVELVESDYDIASVDLVANLHRLRAMGVRTAIDDFGTGSSSLERVRRLGADLLKIDKTFITDITSREAEAPLVAAALAMADAMGMAVVAEGVEEPHQRDWLAARGCAFGQGWLFGRPVPASPTGEAASTGEAAPAPQPPRMRSRSHSE